MLLCHGLTIVRPLPRIVGVKAVLLLTLCVYGASDLGPGFGDDRIPTVDAQTSVKNLWEVRGLKPFFENSNTLSITPVNVSALLQHLAFYESAYANFNEGIHIKGWANTTDTRALETILNSFNALKLLRISSDFATSGMVIRQLLSFNQGVEALDVSSSALTNASMTELVNILSHQTHQRLRHIDLRGNVLTTEQRTTLSEQYRQATLLMDAETLGMTQVVFGGSLTPVKTSIRESAVHVLMPNVVYLPDNRPLNQNVAAVAAKAPERVKSFSHYEEEKVLKVTGQDGRRLIKTTQQWPHSAIVKLYVTFPGGEKVTGSGVMIGPRHVLTAGHYVFYDKGWVTEIEAVPGVFGKGRPFGQSQGTQAYASKSWTSHLVPEDDLALIVLEDDLGRQTGWFGLQGGGVSPGQSVSLSGYPIDKGDGTTLWQMSGVIDRVENRRVYYRIDTERGQGGGPLWYDSEQGPMVVGLHAFRHETENSGVKLTAEILSLIRQWVWSTWERKGDAGVSIQSEWAVLNPDIRYAKYPDRSYLSIGGTEIRGQKPTARCADRMDPGAEALENVFKDGGEDSRRYIRTTHEWPYSSIVQLSSYFPNQSFVGSGVMVGPAHVLTIDSYLFKEGQWAQRVEVRAGLNGRKEPFGVVQAARLYRVGHGDDLSSTSVQVGLIVLDHTLGEKTGWLGMDATPIVRYPQVAVSGYPLEKGNGRTLWSAEGGIDLEDRRTLQYTIDTSKGQEGGPIWYQKGLDAYVLGLNAGETQTSNVGLRLMPEHLNAIATYIQEHWKVIQASNLSAVLVGSLPIMGSPDVTPPQATGVTSFSPATVAAVTAPDKVFAQQEFERGLGLFKREEYVEARSYFERCANWNHADALNYLGVMYEQGYGVAVNPETARVYYERGANLGSGQACSNLGDYYGHKNDTNTAMRWFKRGAELGHQGCQDNLDMYDAGV